MHLDRFFSALVTHHHFAGSVLISLGEHIVLSKGYGFASVAQHRRNTPGTAFEIASVTKQFTALALLRLQDQGTLSMQDHACAYLPPCPLSWKGITLHELLTHTSGLGHWDAYPAIRTGRVTTPEHLIEILKRSPLRSAPGTQFHYSSPGYVVLAAILQRVARTTYGAYLRQAIFAPLSMRHTSVAVASGARAVGYRDGIPVPGGDLRLPLGAADLWSTTDDLQRWDRALLNQTLLSRPAARALFTPYVATPDGFGYGYAWYSGTLRTHPILFHPGDNPGFLAMNILFPRERATIILLSNNAPRILRDTFMTDTLPSLMTMLFG